MSIDFALFVILLERDIFQRFPFLNDFVIGVISFNFDIEHIYYSYFM